MKWLSCAFLSVFLASSALADDSLVGSWTYYKKMYQGKELTDPSGTLRLHFDFKADGTDELYWWHDGDHDHCHRNGTYTVKDGLLEETATTVDPGNTPFCGQDPDMQPGKFSKIPMHFENGELWLAIPLASEELYFVWKRDPAAQDGAAKREFREQAER